MKLSFKEMPDAVRYLRMTAEELREHFLLQGLFQPGEISLAYVDLERTIVGGITPTAKPLKLAAPEWLRSDHFTDRREIGIMNIGAAGSVTVDGETYDMRTKDALYIGLGNKDISFRSAQAASPAKFYLVSYPAHHKHPVTLARKKDAEPLHLGSDAESNKRTIYKYVFNGGIKSCQLVMGFTEMAPGNVWNTMPAHKHMRRTEVYCYFDLPDDAVVFHLMGKPEETRHLVIRNGEAVFSPGWSIHAGSGTRNYTFIWAMGGENQDYTDMDAINMAQLR